MANFENPETQAASNIALHTVMLFFVTLCVTIRIYTRFFITRQLGLDDCKETLLCNSFTLIIGIADFCVFGFVRPIETPRVGF